MMSDDVISRSSVINLLSIVPPLETIASETSRSVTITVERTETTTAHMKQSSSRDKIIKRPNRPPPSPKTSS